jgi:RNA polymerase sigma-54 factor
MEQRLVQSPQMIQAMQILQLSSLDLEERIADELVENPFLEVKEEERPEGDESGDESGDGDETDADAAFESMVETLERYERDFGDGRSRVPAREDVDRKLEAMQNTPATYHSLGGAVLEQVALSGFDERRHEIAEYLAYSLDHRGYLPDPLEEVAEACPVEGVTVEELEAILDDLRHATHSALGARDIQHCLLLQVEAGALEHLDDGLVRTLIESHIEDIVANRLPRIARATGHTLEEVKQAIESLRTLDPVPGREYGQVPAETIHPDVVVEEIEGSFEVRLTRGGVPELTISATYKKILKQTNRGDAVRKWIKQRLESARWFMDALEQRQSTLLRVSKAVFERQEDFLRRGVKGLAPLRMMEVAEATGVHISTVSRAVAGKYAQTPHGILPLRFFFSGGTAKASGGMASQASIKQRIKELIEKEDTSAPLSDDRLADLLREREGITIARRTITKYRKAMAIPSSSQRKRF